MIQESQTKIQNYNRHFFEQLKTLLKDILQFIHKPLILPLKEFATKYSLQPNLKSDHWKFLQPSYIVRSRKNLNSPVSLREDQINNSSGYSPLSKTTLPHSKSSKKFKIDVQIKTQKLNTFRNYFMNNQGKV